MRHHRAYPVNGNRIQKLVEEPQREDVWVNSDGKQYRLKDMSTDHLVNAVTALLRDQLRQELGLDRTKYKYMPAAWAQNGTVARVLYVKMAEELQRRSEL